MLSREKLEQVRGLQECIRAYGRLPGDLSGTEQEEYKKQLANILQQLEQVKNPDDRALLMDHYVTGYSLSEIARIRSCSTRTLQRRLRKLVT